jgi:hypothetical protein
MRRGAGEDGVGEAEGCPLAQAYEVAGEAGEVCTYRHSWAVYGAFVLVGDYKPQSGVRKQHSVVLPAVTLVETGLWPRA